MPSFFKSKSGKHAILRLYEQKLDDLQIDYRYQQLETSFGQTNIIVTGQSDRPPVLLFHGSNACAPIALEVYPNLHKHFQIFAVDLLAQPNKSEGQRLSMKDHSYGQWIHEILGILNLEQVTLAGFSLGGLAILKALSYKADRIQAAFLTAPAYIVNGNPLKALFKVFIPMRRYMSSHKPRFIEKFLDALFTERDPFAIQFLSKVFLHFDMDFTPVPTISKKEAAAIQTPITIIAAKNDLLFPGAKMLKRAKAIFPSLRETILLENSKHVQNKQDNLLVETLILKSTLSSERVQ